MEMLVSSFLSTAYVLLLRRRRVDGNVRRKKAGCASTGTGGAGRAGRPERKERAGGGGVGYIYI